MPSKRILIGADPEVFVKNEGNVLISGHGLVPGDKKNPYKVPYGAVQVDGMALEFNIDPADNPDAFIFNIQNVKAELERMVLIKGLHLVTEPVAIFDQHTFDATPAEAKVLGCDPDYNAWTGEINPRPDNNTTMRTASGHIHIGWTDGKDPMDEAHFEDCRTVAKQMDYYLGLPSLWWDQDNRRRQMYGQAGAFRPKPYGVEYRVMSNVWLTDMNLAKWIWNAAYKGINDLMAGRSSEQEHGMFAVDTIAGGASDWHKSPQGHAVYASMNMRMPAGYPKTKKAG